MKSPLIKASGCIFLQEPKYSPNNPENIVIFDGQCANYTYL